MLLKKVLLTVSASVAMVLGAIAIVIACNPSTLPPQCPQSIFLAKFAPSIFVIPPDDAPFTVPIGMLPFVSWDDDTGACADPVSAEFEVMLECTDIEGGTFDLEETFAAATPATPGPQPAGGTTVDFTMPGDILPSTCDVVATYTVEFGPGIGTSPLVAVGDLQICLVEPSPADPSGDTPRLDLELLTPEPLPGRGGEEGVYTFHAGDQEYIYIRVENNDLQNKLEIDFESIGRQMSIFPFLPEFDSEEEAYGAGVFRISEPDDTFPADFFFEDEPLPFNRIPGEPGGIGDGRIETRIELEPGEVDIFGIAINSFGACADGSCNERNLCGTGLFIDEQGNEVARDPACIQFNYFVQSGNPRYPGITFDEEIKVAPNTDSQWSGVSFFDENGGLIDQTHKGNLLPEFVIFPEPPGIQVTGDDIDQDPAAPQFSDRWTDHITLPRQPSSAEWDAVFFIEEPAGSGFFIREENSVVLEGPGTVWVSSPLSRCRLPFRGSRIPANAPLASTPEMFTPPVIRGPPLRVTVKSAEAAASITAGPVRVTLGDAAPVGAWHTVQVPPPLITGFPERSSRPFWLPEAGRLATSAPVRSIAGRAARAAA